MRPIIFALLIISLAACRANPERSNAEERTARADATSRDSEKFNINNELQKESAPVTNGGGYLSGDGPGSNTPDNLHNTPDAVPRAEPLHRYANRPYTVLGKTYTPLTQTGTYKKRGVASWYGKKFHGQRTSIGEIYDMYAMTAAHTTLPIPSYARVTHTGNGRSVIVRVNDRGPFMHERVIDLSYTAASKLGIIGKGQGEVIVESINTDGSNLATQEPLQISPLPPETPFSIPAETDSGKTYLQLGAFSSQQGAESFLQQMRDKLAGNDKQLSLARKGSLVKVRIGPYSSADKARNSALELQTILGFKPMVSVH